jgi:hypothetical protein
MWVALYTDTTTVKGGVVDHSPGDMVGTNNTVLWFLAVQLFVLIFIFRLFFLEYAARRCIGDFKSERGWRA